jgi:hypothetical protein
VTPSTPSLPEEEILARGLADWVMFAEVYGLTRDWALARSLDPRTEILRVLRALLSQGLVEIGDVQKGAGFVPWGLGVDEALARVVERWDRLSAEPNLGEVAWLSNTAEGDARAEEILQQRPTR